MASIVINGPSSHEQTVPYPSGPVVATASVTNSGNADGWARLNITGAIGQVGVPTRVPAQSSASLTTSVAIAATEFATFFSAEVEELNASGVRIGSLGSHDNFHLSVEKRYVPLPVPDQQDLETIVVEAYQAAPDTSTFDTLPPPFIYTKPEAEPAPVEWWAGTPSFETLPPDTSGGDWWAPVFADPAPVVAEVYVTPWDEPGYVETYVREDYVAPWDDVEPFVPAPVWGGWGDELASYR